jgi:hypothetical protein
MTPLAIYDEQPDHFVLMYRAPKSVLIAQLTALAGALAVGGDTTCIPVPAELLEACRPALDELARRLGLGPLS